jgi:hypothetical protein
MPLCLQWLPGHASCSFVFVFISPSFWLPSFMLFQIQTARSHWISKSEFFKCFVLPLGWVVGDEWIMNLKGYGWKHLCPNVVIHWQAELEELETTKDNTPECVQDDSRADIQVRYVPVNWLLYREVAQFPLYCSFTWQHCALVNYMLLCVDLTWSQHGTCRTLQNMSWHKYHCNSVDSHGGALYKNSVQCGIVGPTLWSFGYNCVVPFVQFE